METDIKSDIGGSDTLEQLPFSYDYCHHYPDNNRKQQSITVISIFFFSLLIKLFRD